MGLIGTDERVLSLVPQVLYARSIFGRFTGALISQDLVLSVAHGVTSPFHLTSTTTNVDFKTGDLRTKVSGQVVYVDRRLDISLIQLNKPLDLEPLNLNSASQTTLYQDKSLIGFPADLGDNQYTATTDFINIVGDNLQYKFDTFGGSSGSPVLDFNGEIVAVHKQWHPWGNINAGTKIDNDIINLVNHYDALKGPVNYHEPNAEGLSENLHRFLNTENHTHMYTADLNVVEDVRKNSNWVEEYIDVEVDIKEHVYEFFNHITKSFFYTKNDNEKSWIEDNLDHFEYNDKTFGVADNTMYRMYNPTTGTHFFTESEHEAEYIIANLNYTNEGFL